MSTAMFDVHPHPVRVGMDGAGAALTAAREAAASALSDDDLQACLAECEALSARVAELASLLLREADDRDLGRRLGAPSTTAWLRARFRLRPGKAKSRLDVAHRLHAPDPDGEVSVMDWAASVTGPPPRGAMPATAAAMRAGTVSAEHARVIASVLARIPGQVADDVIAEGEADLAGWAGEHDPAAIARLGEHLLRVLDPDGCLDDDEDAVRRRELRFNEETGTIRGRLDREAMAQVRAALDPLAVPCPATDGTKDPRSPARRVADALVELARRACTDGDLPAARGARPHLSLIVELDTLLTRTSTEDVAPGELAWGGPISAEAVRRIACDAGISRIITDPAGVPLDVGREHRTVTPGQFVALVARDGGCVFPGCTRPASWCEAHHLVHWADGGATSLDNMVLLRLSHESSVGGG